MEREVALLQIRKKLATQLNCNADDFLKAGVQYVINEKERKTPSFQIVAMGNSVIVSVCECFKNRVMPFLKNRTREELFECPFLYGQSIYFIPDFKREKRPLETKECTYTKVENEKLQGLLHMTGFQNALDYDEDGNLISKIVFLAEDQGKIVGMAGADEVFDGVWEIGVDVLEEYRGKGIATDLVSVLTDELISRGIVPIYCAASTNIASQAVAYRSGLLPAWVSSYHTYLDSSKCFE